MKISSRIPKASSVNGKKRRCKELKIHLKPCHSFRQRKAIKNPKVRRKSWTHPSRQQKSAKDPKIHRRFWTRFPRNWITLKNAKIHRKSFRHRNPSSIIGFPKSNQAAKNKSRERSLKRTKKKTKRRWSTKSAPHREKKKFRKFTFLQRRWKERHKAKMKKLHRSCAMGEWKKSGIQSHEMIRQVRKNVNISRYMFHGHKGESPKKPSKEHQRPQYTFS